MKPPKCRSCGKEHWERVCPHIANGPEVTLSIASEPLRKYLKTGKTGDRFDPKIVLTSDFGSGKPGSNPGAGASSESARQQPPKAEKSKKFANVTKSTNRPRAMAKSATTPNPAPSGTLPTPGTENPTGVGSVAAGMSETSSPGNRRRGSFDRGVYQREYMRDLPKAKAEGLTVKQWREKHSK